MPQGLRDSNNKMNIVKALSKTSSSKFIENITHFPEEVKVEVDQNKLHLDSPKKLNTEWKVLR